MNAQQRMINSLVKILEEFGNREELMDLRVKDLISLYLYLGIHISYWYMRKFQGRSLCVFEKSNAKKKECIEAKRMIKFMSIIKIRDLGIRPHLIYGLRMALRKNYV